MTFPEDILDIRVDLNIGGTWTNISDTGDVRAGQGITIKRGRSAEAGDIEHGRCSLTLSNLDGKYSPRNPSSPYFGLLGRNTPLRVSVMTGDPYLSLDGDPANYASTPDVAALDIVGDLDLRAEVTMDWQDYDNNQVLIAKWETTGDQRSYSLRVHEKSLVLNWSTTGANVLFASWSMPTVPDRAAVRATLDVNNGLGGYDVNLYWSESMDGDWTQIGETLTGPSTTSIFASTAPLKVAGQDTTTSPNRNPFTGRAHRFEVRSGVGGAAVADVDFTAQTVGDTSFADDAGLTWTVNGVAEITNRQERFYGEVSEWPPEWETGGYDVTVPIEAAGPLRRYRQGAAPLDSTLRRRIPSDPDLLAYWPMEEGESATQCYSPVAGVAPMTLSGATFAADDSLPGSSALPTFADNATLFGTVPQGSGAGWHVELVYKITATLTATVTTFFRVQVTGSDVTLVRVQASTAGIRILLSDEDGTEIDHLDHTDPDAIAAFTGNWARLQIFAAPDGANTDFFARWINIDTGVQWTVNVTEAVDVGDVSGVEIFSFAALWDGTPLGHIGVFDTAATDIYDDADEAFAGEFTLDRMFRVANEQAFPLTLFDGDTSYPSQQVGPQTPATTLDVLQSAADVDGGVLFESRADLKLVYRDRTSLYNQDVVLSLDYSGSDGLVTPLRPTDDDQLLRNDVTVQREGGSSGRAVLEAGALSVQAPPDGVGTYDESLTLNLFDDDQPEQHAHWRMHLGTWDEARYPTVRVDLAAAPASIPAALAVDIGDRMQITNPPAWLPPDTIDLLVQGYTETLSQYEWTIEFNCSPAGPWNVAHVEDTVYGWVDTSGTELAGAATSTGTLLPVTVTDGPVWVTGSVTYTGATATGAGTSLTPDYLVCADADAADINIGDNVRLFDSDGNLTEFTVFEVVSKPSAFGFTNVTFTPDAAAVTVAGDQLRVLTVSGSAEDFPLPVRVGGEVMAVTGIANDDPIADMFTRTEASGWGSADSGQAWTTSGGSASDFSVSGGAGLHSVGTLNVSRFSVAAADAADFDVQVTVSTPVLAAGNSQQAYLIGRYLDASNYYGARLDFTTAQAVTLTIIKVVAGVPGAFTTATTALTHAADTQFRMRFQGQGSALKAKVWLASGTEPTAWDTEVADVDLTAAGSVGVRTRFLTGNTNTLPVAVSFDDFASPQVLTVERSVNSVIKAQVAGTDVRLAYPPITAL